MPLDIWFGQFNITGGQVQEQGPYVGIFEGDADEADAVGVYIVVEPCGRADADLCAAVVEVVARGFSEPGQLLTASLKRGISAAHDYVRRRRPAEDDPGFGVGLSVLATRRGEAYIAQAGPALACIKAGATSRVVEPARGGEARPVGSDPQVQPEFARFTLRPGDSAILLFRSATELTEPRRLLQIVAQPPEHALPEIYLRGRGESEFAALYLAVTGEHQVAPSIPANGTVDAAGRVAAGAVSRPTVGRSAEARTRGRGGAGRGRTVARAALPAEETEAGFETLPEADDPDGLEQIERRNGHPSIVRPGEGPPPVNSLTQMMEVVRTIVPRRTPLGTLAPTERAITRRRLVIAGVIGVAALLLLTLLPNLAREGKTEKYHQIVRSADEAISTAEREQDPGRRRTLLAQAQSAVDEARTLAASPAELLPLEQRLADQLAVMNGVRELTDLVVVADLAAPGLAAPSANQVVAGPSLYLLDPAAGKVMALPREGEPRPATVFEEGRPAGQNRTGKARHMAWWPGEGGRPAVLLVLDDQRRLWSVDPRGDIRPVALGNTADWRSDNGIAVGSSHLYVLDTAGNQVWRYAQSANGFPNAPEQLLGPRASLRDATGISYTGEVIVATSDGRLLKIADGREQPVLLQAFDRPLLAPSPPLLGVGDGTFYVADRGNQRIVRVTREGVFQGQLTNHRLAGLRAVALDESQTALYAIAGQSLVRASIPR